MVQSEGNTTFLRAARSGNYDKVLEYLNSNIDINTSNANGLNALHLASKDGHYDIVFELLKRGAKVDLATRKGNTALHIASLAGKEEIAKLLVRHGASPNVQSQNGFTPLYMAAQENHEVVVKFLLANGANQSLATEDGFTPLAVAMQQGHDKIVALLLENDSRGKVRLPALHIAAKKDDVKAAKLLLENEHNPDITSKSGFTPLHIAAHYGNDAIGELLIAKSADVNYPAKHNITPLHVACKWGKFKMCELLLNNGATIEMKTKDGLTPLHCAARSGHDQLIELLLERNAPISAKTKNGLAPLHMATQGDHVESAKILLNNHAPVDDVTVDYLTALHVAAHCGHVKVAKLLLEKGADANSRALNGFTPLHIACKKNRIKVVELLLKHGANISATTESGLTPLHVASFMGSMNIVIFLLQHNASPDAPTVRGETPLHLAARSNQTDIIRILLRNGAQVDARAREQQTPLHIASRLGNVDIVMLLLQHGAKIDSSTKDLYTALHIAAKEGQDEVAAALLDNGAEIDAKTTKGFTPLHLTSKYGHTKVVDLLLQKNAKIDAQGKNLLTPLHVAIHYDKPEVAKMLLDNGASVHSKAKNGYTPLHIAAKKNQVYIGQNLLIAKADPNDASNAGFIPLHLSAQEGHYDLTSLLIAHNADANYQSNNGLTPLHLASQEDRVDVTKILIENNADVNAMTNSGYTPLHIASHFGHLNMVRYLIGNGADVNCVTETGCTPLHQAAQQGHVAVVNILLENAAQPNSKNINDQTPLEIAQKLGYISVIETLKMVTSKPGTPMLSDDKYKVLAPEIMQEPFFTDSEDEGGDEVFLEDQPYRYLTVDEMRSLGDDSLPIDVTRDEKMDSNRMINSTDSSFFPPQAIEDSLSPQNFEKFYTENLRKLSVDNVDISEKQHPVRRGFLVSFLVDARGGAMHGCRHSGIRMIIPPLSASSPTRITCRYLKPQKSVNPPPLMEGEALVSRILELGPSGVKFLGPIILDVPHFASVKNHEREIVILRSDNGETWKEHVYDYSGSNIMEMLKSTFDKEDLNQVDDPNSGRVTRIVTQDLPQYFAIVSRVRQEVHAIGPDGDMISSVVVPQVQAIFPQGALTKKIKVGLQVQTVDPELTAKLLGRGVAVSPIVTIEPRRRKFHKAITLSIPTPRPHSQGMINQYSGSAPTLRLLCSITGGTTRAQWEDVTGSTPLTFVNDNVSFTTTVSARFWLIDCRNINESTKMATDLYKEVIFVPFMARFMVFAKRIEPLVAKLRVFCMTDDSEEKTLENQESFVEIAKSRNVEVFENKPLYVEFSGNLVPITKSGDQLKIVFRAFRENRLPFTVRVKDQHTDLIGRCMFMREPKMMKGDPPQQPLCSLNVLLPDNIATETCVDTIRSYRSIWDSYASGDFQILEIANLLGVEWPKLAYELGISRSDIENIKNQYPNSSSTQVQVMIKQWMNQTENKYQDEEFERALKRLSQKHVPKMSTRSEVKRFKAMANYKGFARHDYLDSLIYDEKDLMKESESIESLIEFEKFLEKQAETLHDIEEKKYIGEEKEFPCPENGDEDEPEIKKTVAEIRYDFEKRLSEDVIIAPSPQKAEIFQEISEIRQQSIVEEKMQDIEQQLPNQKSQKSCFTKSDFVNDDVTLSSKAKKDDTNNKNKIESKIPIKQNVFVTNIGKPTERQTSLTTEGAIDSRLETKTSAKLESPEIKDMKSSPQQSPAEFYTTTVTSKVESLQPLKSVDFKRAHESISSTSPVLEDSSSAGLLTSETCTSYAEKSSGHLKLDKLNETASHGGDKADETDADFSPLLKDEQQFSDTACSPIDVQNYDKSEASTITDPIMTKDAKNSPIDFYQSSDLDFDLESSNLIKKNSLIENSILQNAMLISTIALSKQMPHGVEDIVATAKGQVGEKIKFFENTEVSIKGDHFDYEQMDVAAKSSEKSTLIEAVEYPLKDNDNSDVIEKNTKIEFILQKDDTADMSMTFEDIGNVKSGKIGIEHDLTEPSGGIKAFEGISEETRVQQDPMDSSKGTKAVGDIRNIPSRLYEIEKNAAKKDTVKPSGGIMAVEDSTEVESEKIGIKHDSIEPCGGIIAFEDISGKIGVAQDIMEPSDGIMAVEEIVEVKDEIFSEPRKIEEADAKKDTMGPSTGIKAFECTNEKMGVSQDTMEPSKEIMAVEDWGEVKCEFSSKPMELDEAYAKKDKVEVKSEIKAFEDIREKIGVAQDIMEPCKGIMAVEDIVDVKCEISSEPSKIEEADAKKDTVEPSSEIKAFKDICEKIGVAQDLIEPSDGIMAVEDIVEVKDKIWSEPKEIEEADARKDTVELRIGIMAIEDSTEVNCEKIGVAQDIMEPSDGIMAVEDIVEVKCEISSEPSKIEEADAKKDTVKPSSEIKAFKDICEKIGVAQDLIEPSDGIMAVEDSIEVNSEKIGVAQDLIEPSDGIMAVEDIVEVKDDILSGIREIEEADAKKDTVEPSSGIEASKDICKKIRVAQDIMEPSKGIMAVEDSIEINSEKIGVAQDLIEPSDGIMAVEDIVEVKDDILSGIREIEEADAKKDTVEPSSGIEASKDICEKIGVAQDIMEPSKGIMAVEDSIEVNSEKIGVAQDIMEPSDGIMAVEDIVEVKCEISSELREIEEADAKQDTVEPSSGIEAFECANEKIGVSQDIMEPSKGIMAVEDSIEVNSEKIGLAQDIMEPSYGIMAVEDIVEVKCEISSEPSEIEEADAKQDTMRPSSGIDAFECTNEKMGVSQDIMGPSDGIMAVEDTGEQIGVTQYIMEPSKGSILDTAELNDRIETQQNLTKPSEGIVTVAPRLMEDKESVNKNKEILVSGVIEVKDGSETVSALIGERDDIFGEMIETKSEDIANIEKIGTCHVENEELEDNFKWIQDFDNEAAHIYEDKMKEPLEVSGTKKEFDDNTVIKGIEGMMDDDNSNNELSKDDDVVEISKLILNEIYSDVEKMIVSAPKSDETLTMETSNDDYNRKIDEHVGIKKTVIEEFKIEDAIAPGSLLEDKEVDRFSEESRVTDYAPKRIEIDAKIKDIEETLTKIIDVAESKANLLTEDKVPEDPHVIVRQDNSDKTCDAQRIVDQLQRTEKLIFDSKLIDEKFNDTVVLDKTFMEKMYHTGGKLTDIETKMDNLRKINIKTETEQVPIKLKDHGIKDDVKEAVEVKAIQKSKIPISKSKIEATKKSQTRPKSITVKSSTDVKKTSSFTQEKTVVSRSHSYMRSTKSRDMKKSEKSTPSSVSTPKHARQSSSSGLRKSFSTSSSSSIVRSRDDVSLRSSANSSISDIPDTVNRVSSSNVSEDVSNKGSLIDITDSSLPESVALSLADQENAGSLRDLNSPEEYVDTGVASPQLVKTPKMPTHIIKAQPQNSSTDSQVVREYVSPILDINLMSPKRVKHKFDYVNQRDSGKFF